DKINQEDNEIFHNLQYPIGSLETSTNQKRSKVSNKNDELEKLQEMFVA
ncbi:12584_t:CDS:1, partial [Cetraspora pellucida]